MINEFIHRAKKIFAWSMCLLLMVSCTLTTGQEHVAPTQTITVTSKTLATTDKEQSSPSVVTKEPNTATSTPVVNVTKTSISPSELSQKDDAIPSCINYTSPSPVSFLKGIDGFIYYGTNNVDHLLVLSGAPLQSFPIELPVMKADSFTISKDEAWLLAYSQKPEALTYGSQYPYFLVSNKGEVYERKLDLSHMTSVAHQDLKTANLLYWTIDWLTNDIIKVRGAFGESLQTIIPIFVYQYFDVEQDVWLNEPFLSLLDREPYQWVDPSPDLTRILYLTKNSDFVLWDTEKKQQLWADFLGSSQLPPYVQWSSNGQKVAFWTDGFPFNVQLLDRDGSGYEQIQNPSYGDEENEFQPYRGFFSWSPDSRYLAISGIIHNRKANLRTAMLYIYDVEESKFTYRCPLGDNSDKTISSDILWSPDGRFIVTKFPQSDTVPFRVYDLEDGRVYQIETSGFAAIEWVKSFSLMH